MPDLTSVEVATVDQTAIADRTTSNPCADVDINHILGMPLCHGGCLRNRIGIGAEARNAFCPVFYRFSCAAARLQKIANAERRARML